MTNHKIGIIFVLVAIVMFFIGAAFYLKLDITKIAALAQFASLAGFMAILFACNSLTNDEKE